MKALFSILVKYPLFSGGTILLLALAGGAYLMLQNGGAKEETLIVRAGPFLQQVSTSGTVVAADDVDLGFTQGGRMSRVYVKVGDVVATGKVLAEIENGDVRATVLQRQAALEAEEARLRSLLQGTRPEELAVSEAEVESARATLLQRNQAVIEAIESAYTNADDAVRNQADQFITNPRSSSPTVDFISIESQLIIDIERLRTSVESTLISWQKKLGTLSQSNDLSEAISTTQNDLVKVSSLLSAASTALNSALPSSSVTQGEITEYIADIATARSSINSSISSLTSAATARTSAIASLNTAEKNLALKQAGATEADVDVQRAQVRVAEALLEDARAALRKTFITAPFRGVVTRVDVTPGNIVSPNGSEITMISTDAFEIESYVPEINIPLLATGNTAVVTLDAYGSDAPFDARVASIDPAQTIRDGVSTYRAVIQFTEQDPRIKSGMTANVTITTQERENVLSVPQGIVFQRDGKKYVYVSAKGGSASGGKAEIEEREVTTGSVSSLGNIEIISGLSEGDVVILRQD